MVLNVLEYLENAVKSSPDKTMVVYRDVSYTWVEAQSLARRLGSTLARTIGQTKTPVGVLVSRSVEPLIFFLGVLYSGNYYVPIDPDMPTAKKQAIIDDAGIRVLLSTEESKVSMMDVCFDGAIISLDELDTEECEIPPVGGDDPLYMVYTSGSTGKPKGVLKSHRAVISFIEAYCNTFDFSSDEIIGNQTPFFFDASAKDIYLLLKLGCTMEILPSTLFTLPPELIDYMNERQITFASWVPTALSIVAQLNPFSMVKPTSLKKLFFVGEVMPMKHLNTWRKYLPDLQYVNLYGQSELAGICCYYEVQGTFENDATLPMGVPLSNCKVYLLDQGSVVTESGHIGEMYIVSDALATEYYHDEEKTQKSFLYMDFGDGLVRCFKTGDLAQYDSAGNLLFASRTDFQIKHMGHRIELGEIEAVAGAVPEIQRCCCLYHAEKRKIVLFCELDKGTELTGQQVRSLLRQKLSDYMLPGKVVIMDALPLSANGKIDRQKLKGEL